MAEPDSDIITVEMSQTTSAGGAITRKRRVRLPVAVALSLATFAIGGGAATGLNRIGQAEATTELATLRSNVETLTTNVATLSTKVAELTSERAQLSVKLEAANDKLRRVEQQLDSLNEYLRRK